MAGMKKTNDHAEPTKVAKEKKENMPTKKTSYSTVYTPCNFTYTAGTVDCITWPNSPDR